MTDAHRHSAGAPPISQEWDLYTEEEHDRWRRLYRRQMEILPGRACSEFLEGLKKLDMSRGIPNFKNINKSLRATNWEVVGVEGLVEDKHFFELLSQRLFPSTCFIRREDQFDYIVEPDIFHDGFGHLPMLMNPVIADYMQAYGKGGLKVLDDPVKLKQLARLYWYTIEFGLVQTPDGLRIYGSGIVSSPSESVTSLELTGRLRVAFDLIRVMSTEYEIFHEQDIYFVISGIEHLIEVTMRDFAREHVYESVAERPIISAGGWVPCDRLYGPNPKRV
ncbi:phenylalanine 4-monooxygenase [Candidatus Kaiserbacteria bacterium]|nr:phenylalanine 4-monooxygenase [Candidatus Kaiserbacteria bacterium]